LTTPILDSRIMIKMPPYVAARVMDWLDTVPKMAAWNISI
jgi:hypothetical protein